MRTTDDLAGAPQHERLIAASPNSIGTLLGRSGVCLSTLIMGSWLQEELWSARKLIVAVRRPRQPAGENFWAREGRVLDGKWCSCDGRGRLRAAWAMGRVAHASDGARSREKRESSFRFVTRLSVVEMEPTYTECQLRMNRLSAEADMGRDYMLLVTT